MNRLKNTPRSILLVISLLMVVAASAAVAEDEEHGYLGVMLQNVSTSMAKALQLDEDEGVMINQVIDDSPAAKAGLEDGDVILEFNGKTIDDYADLTKAVRATAPGDMVDLRILHDGKRQTKQVEMGEAEGGEFLVDGDKRVFINPELGEGGAWMDDDGQRKVIIMSDGDDDDVWFGDDDEEHLKHFGFNADRGFMGVDLDDLNEQLGEYFGVDDGKGALVTSVREDSPAAKAGLKAGDVIINLGDEDIADAGDVHKVMADTEPEQEIEVQIVRKGRQKTLKITLGELPESMTTWSSAPHIMKRFEHSFDLPEGFDHDIRVIAPLTRSKLREHHRSRLDSDELDELHGELDELRQELKDLQKELKK